MLIWQGVITGQIASKANRRRLVVLGGHPRSIKSAPALAWAASAKAQISAMYQGEPYDGDVALYATIYYASRRPDLDESLLMDALQGVVIRNDRQIREKHIWGSVDKANPRCVVGVSADLGEMFNGSVLQRV